MNQAHKMYDKIMKIQAIKKETKPKFIENFKQIKLQHHHYRVMIMKIKTQA